MIEINHYYHLLLCSSLISVWLILQNVPNIALYATMKQNAMNAHKASSWLKMETARVSKVIFHFYFWCPLIIFIDVHALIKPFCPIWWLFQVCTALYHIFYVYCKMVHNHVDIHVLDHFMCKFSEPFINFHIYFKE